mmetsp:Transcript_36706/g.86357  ORF Transcript_36706/g.86357 Transcript_36706/m.86357 type:complete len:212 (+) Transcript_36706:312-947(+)
MAAECIPRPRPTHAFLPHASTSTPKTQMQNRAQPRSPFPDAALTPGSEWLARLAFLHSAFPSHLSDSCPHPRSQHPSPSPDRLGEVLVADPRDWDPRAAQGGLERAVLEHAQPVHVDLHRGVAALQVPAAGRLLAELGAAMEHAAVVESHEQAWFQARLEARFCLLLLCLDQLRQRVVCPEVLLHVVLGYLEGTLEWGSPEHAHHRPLVVD